MAETHLDHPGEIRWYPRQGPAPVIGPCPHDCQHTVAAVIAEGPDFEHYTLDRCLDVCGGTCRAWSAEYPPAASPPWWTPDRPKQRHGPWLHVAGAAVTGRGQ